MVILGPSVLIAQYKTVSCPAPHATHMHIFPKLHLTYELLYLYVSHDIRSPLDCPAVLHESSLDCPAVLHESRLAELPA